MLSERLSEACKTIIHELRPDTVDFKELYASAIKKNSKLHIKGDFTDVVVEAVDSAHPDTYYYIFSDWTVIKGQTDATYIKNQILTIYLPFKAISKALLKKGIDVSMIKDCNSELIVSKLNHYQYEIVEFKQKDVDEE